MYHSLIHSGNLGLFWVLCISYICFDWKTVEAKMVRLQMRSEIPSLQS